MNMMDVPGWNKFYQDVDDAPIGIKSGMTLMKERSS